MTNKINGCSMLAAAALAVVAVFEFGAASSLLAAVGIGAALCCLVLAGLFFWFD